MRSVAVQTRARIARHGNPFTLMAILDILEFPDARLRVDGFLVHGAAVAPLRRA